MNRLGNNSFGKFVKGLVEKSDLRAGNPEKDTICTGDVVTMDGKSVGVVIEVKADTVLVEMGGHRMNLNRNQFGKQRIPDCDSCSNQKVYSDSLEDWKCPFCEL